MEDQGGIFIVVEFYDQPLGRWYTISPESLYLRDPIEFNYENERVNLEEEIRKNRYRNMEVTEEELDDIIQQDVEIELLQSYTFFLSHDDDLFSIFGIYENSDNKLSRLRGLPLNTSIIVPSDIDDTTFFGYDELIFMNWDPITNVSVNTSAKQEFIDIMEMLRANTAKPSTEIRLGFLVYHSR